MKTFTKAYILARRSCYSREQVLALSFINKEIITIDDILYSEIPLKDKCWFTLGNYPCDKLTWKKAMLKLGWLILPIFEKEKPSDIRPRVLIDSVEAYFGGNVDSRVLFNANLDCLSARNEYNGNKNAHDIAEAIASICEFCIDYHFDSYWPLHTSSIVATNNNIEKEFITIIKNNVCGS
ncbi:MAG: hypothetical protein ACRCX2_00365 [Paraclostridium sp.]